jgi:hypothetical protein
MARHRKQTEEIFCQLAVDLAVTRPDLVDSVLCPLCLRSLGREALDSQGDDRLTVEHIVPSALGGGLITLTCKRCNNRQGSEVDAHFVKMVRAGNSLAGDGSTLRGSLQIGGLRLPMKIAWGGGKGKNVIRILGGKQEELSQFIGAIRGLKQGDSLQLRTDLDYNVNRQRRALLRIAYLSLFRHFGYKYVLSKGGNAIRRLIVGETRTDELWRLTPRIQIRDIRGFFEKPVVISPVRCGHFIVAFLVFVRIERGEERYFGALMPPPNVPEDRVIELLTKVGRELDGKPQSVRVMEPFAEPEP